MCHNNMGTIREFLTLTIKTILLPLEGLAREQSVCDAAFKIAKQFNAHIDVLHVHMDSKDVVPFVGQGMSAPVVEQMMSSVEEKETEMSQKAKQMFEDFVKRNNIPLIKDAKEKEPNSVSTSYHEKSGRALEVIPRWGRLYDLVVFPKLEEDDEDTAEEIVVDAALYETGRPLLFMPNQYTKDIGGKVGIYWNGSLEAARALEVLKQFSSLIKEVTILTSSEEDMGLSSKHLARYLSFHNLQSSHVILEDKDIGKSLVKAVDKKGLDLLIMGAYSHSRIRHVFFGSTTNHVLFNTHIPVIFTH
jgi:nucleotide-binding universal stress UspA family protein